MNKAPVFYNEIQEEEIQQFIKDQWGEEDNGFICHEIESEYVHTDVQALSGEDDDKIFVTFGVGARKMNSPFPGFNRIEFVMFASNELSTRADGEDIQRCLTAAAELQTISKFPFKNNTWFGPGHTINVSDNFSKKFGYQYFMFVEYSETANLSGIGGVHFLIAIPVYEEEMDWMASNENGSQRFLDEYIEEFECNGAADKMFMIDVPRRVIIPQPLEE